MNPIVAVSFGAGLLAPVNPCGFALLPAYLSTFLQPTDTGVPAPLTQRLRAAVLTGAAITAGFTLTVTAIGAALAAGLRSLIDLIPWLSVVVGLGLVTTGVAILLGRSIPLRLPGVQTRSTAATSRWRLIGFGAGYALASSSCTLAVLLALVTQAVTAGSSADVVAVFAANAAGSALLLLALAMAAALTSTALSVALGRLSRHMHRISGVLLTGSGIYLLVYWLPSLLGGNASAQDNALSRTSGTITTWISTHQSAVALTGGAALAAATLAGVLNRRRRHRDPGGIGEPSAVVHGSVVAPEDPPDGRQTTRPTGQPLHPPTRPFVTNLEDSTRDRSSR